MHFSAHDMTVHYGNDAISDMKDYFLSIPPLILYGFTATKGSLFRAFIIPLGPLKMKGQKSKMPSWASW